jgi:hypothetical protein
MVTNGSTGLAQGDDLGVCGRIGLGDIAVPSAAYDLAVADDDGADRDLSYLQSALGAAQGFFHPEFVGFGVRGHLQGIVYPALAENHFCQFLGHNRRRIEEDSEWQSESCWRAYWGAWRYFCGAA